MPTIMMIQTVAVARAKEKARVIEGTRVKERARARARVKERARARARVKERARAKPTTIGFKQDREGGFGEVRKEKQQ